MSAEGQHGGGADANRVYALGSSATESERLVRQADELAADSEVLLDRVGLGPGQSAVDMGCGPKGILDLLARRIGPGGPVVGVDADLSHIAMAAEFVAAQGLAGVELVAADARATGLASDAFDLVHARALLINVPDPVDVVTEMVRLTRPGGWVAAMEPDTDYAFCYPAHPAFERLCELFPVVFSRNGANPKMGRRVPELFWAAGLTQVGVEARVQLYPHGHSRRTIRLDLMRAMRSHAVAMGVATETELDELDRAARSHLDDPTTIVVSGHLFLTWGLKPPSR